MNTEILQKDNKRFFLFPIKQDEMWKAYKQQVQCFWVAEEIDLEKDIIDWEYKMTDDEKTFIKMVLAFFSNADAIINENLTISFYNLTDYPEAKCFYSMQLLIETIHQ